MITNYNKYVVVQPIKEAIEIDLPVSIEGVNTKVVNSFDKVKNKVFMENTSDGYEINPAEEYYAIVQYKIPEDKLEGNKTSAMNDKIFWATLKLTPEDLFYNYQIVGTDVDISKDHGSIMDKENKVNIKLIKSPNEKIPEDKINGYYLYKVKSDINMVLNSYDVKYDKKNVEKPVDGAMNKAPDVKVGNVYQITNSKGNAAYIRVYKMENNEIFAKDIDTNQSYDNMKLETFQKGKEVNPYKYIKGKLEELKMSSWKTSDSFKGVMGNKPEAIKYITKKYNKVGYYKETLEAWKKYKLESGTEVDDPIIGGIDAVIRTTDNIRNFINKDLQKVYGVDLKKKKKEKDAVAKKEEKPTGQPKEKSPDNIETDVVDDPTETPEEKVQKEEVKEFDKKAQTQQTNIQNKKPEKKKVDEEEDKKQKKDIPGEKKETKPVVAEQPLQLVQTENYKKFINGNNKRL